MGVDVVNTDDVRRTAREDSSSLRPSPRFSRPPDATCASSSSYLSVRASHRPCCVLTASLSLSAARCPELVSVPNRRKCRLVPSFGTVSSPRSLEIYRVLLARSGCCVGPGKVLARWLWRKTEDKQKFLRVLVRPSTYSYTSAQSTTTTTEQPRTDT